MGGSIQMANWASDSISCRRIGRAKKITIDEYYQYIFENTKGLPEMAAKEGLTPLDYMRKYGAFEVEQAVY